MKFNFIKDNIGEYISLFLFYAVITGTYYLVDDVDYSPTTTAPPPRNVRIKRIVQDLIDAFGSDLPAWLQILLFFILFVFFIEFLKFTYKKLISLFKKK